MSSSARNTLTKRRSAPESSNKRSPNPGWAASRFFKTSFTVAPSHDTSDAPPERLRSCVGMRTATARAAHDIQREVTVGGVADRKGLGDRRRLHRLDRVALVLERLGDG